MPPRPAKGRAAQSYVAARGAPDSLESFLGGAALPTHPAGAEDAAMMEVNLKLLQKGHEVTVLKALAELNRQVEVVQEEELLSYMPSIIEAVIRHAEHTNASVRAGIFSLLHGAVKRGRLVKEEIERNLSSLAVAWVSRMNDMEASVRRDARDALIAAFPSEILNTYADIILDGLIDAYNEVIERSKGKQLQDDHLDKRSNVLYSSICAMGYMMRQPIVSRQKIITFIEKESLQPILPLRECTGKGNLAIKAPVVRSSSLSLLCDIVKAKMLTPKIHYCISSALHEAMFDNEAVVVRRAWELMLLWCKEDTETVIGYFHKEFLNDVIGSFERCNDPEVAEVIYPSLVPFLVPLTRDSRCADVAGEFGEALANKLKNLTDVGIQEWRTVLFALMRTWELLCLRSTINEKKGVKLFYNIIVRLVTIMESTSKREFYLKDAVSIVSKSIIRVVRHDEIFKECLQILCGYPDAPLHVLSKNENITFKVSFHMLQAGIIGSILSLPGISVDAERLLLEYAESKLWEAIVELLRHSVFALLGDNNNNNNNNNLFLPAKTVRIQVAKGLIEAIQSNKSSFSNTEDDNNSNNKGENEPPSWLREFFSLVLIWNDTDTCMQLKSLITNSSDGLQWVETSIRDHDMKDPEQFVHLFLKACENADFNTVTYCMSLISEQQRKLSDREKERLRNAVKRSIEATRRLVDNEEEEEDEEEEEEDNITSRTHTGVFDIKRKITSKNSTDDDSNDADVNSDNIDGEREEERDHDDNDEEEEEETDNENDGVNEGKVVMQRLIAWSNLLRKGEELAVLLDFTDNDLILSTIFRTVVAVAPRLHAEQYMSIKALRVAINEIEDPLIQALNKKIHFLSVSDFNILVEHIEKLLDSYNITKEQRDTTSLELFDEIMRNPSCSLSACGQLSRLIPFASNSLLQGIACSGELWTENQVKLQSRVGSSEDIPFAMLDRYCSLDVMKLTMLSCVRTAQLVHLLGLCVPIETCDAVAVTLPLLRAASVQQALADPLRKLLMTKLLPRALLRLNTNEAINSILSSDSEPYFIICTLGGVICDIAMNATNELIVNTRRIASVITEWIVNSLILSKGNAPIHPIAISCYRAFFARLDEAADIINASILSSVSQRHASALQEAMCMLPTIQPREGALLIMTLHRHLGSAPVVVDSTVRQVISYALKQRPIDGVEILAELTSSRILDTTEYNNLVHSIIHLLSRCYRLRHMPPNGRLISQALNDIPISSYDLRRVVTAAVSARRGVILQGRIDDVLKSCVNLILFDAVTECVVSLRETKEEDIPIVTKLIAFTSNCLSDLITSDVKVVRASEVSVTKIAGVMNYAYQWLCATSIAKLENIGMDLVSSAIRAVSLISNLTLVRSEFTFSPIMKQITSKRSLKNIRDEFSVRTPAKMKLFTRHAAIITKTNKQKLALFPHLLAWCITLSGPSRESITKERREEVCHLLDLLCSLLLTPTIPGNKRIEGTYLCVCANSIGHNLGFEIGALARCTSLESMKELAKGAAAVFTLLLQGNTLTIVKDWLETLEKKLQDPFYNFVKEHVSPLLIEESLLDVITKNPKGGPSFDINENYKVTVSLAKKNVTLKYTMEDASVMVQIAFPGAFPLKPPNVTYESGRGCGVSTEKWRSWMLKMTVLLFGGSANLWECVMVFGKNMDAHFSGREPCPICYSIVSPGSHRMPEMRCAVCRNTAFHTECLYNWWSTGGRTVCPLCRSPWVES